MQGKRWKNSNHQSINLAHMAVLEWAEWLARYEAHSGLGYPTESIEAKIMSGEFIGASSGQGGKAHVPMFDMPTSILLVDRAMREMPAGWRSVLQARCFLAGGEFQIRDAWCKVNRRSEQTWHSRLNLGLAWVAGALTAPRSVK